MLAQPAPSDKEIEEQRGHHIVERWTRAAAPAGQFQQLLDELDNESDTTGNITAVMEQ